MSTEHEDNPSGYVTRAECAQTSSEIKAEVKIIRVAIVGEDMQGGLVQKVSSLQNTVNAMQKERRQERSFLRAILKDLVAPVLVAVIVALIVSHPW